MRTATFIAVLATAITLSSCEWLFGKKATAFNIEGTWKLDSLKAPQDSASLTPLLIAMAAKGEKDSSTFQLEFGKDTLVLTTASGNDTLPYSISASTKQISVHKDSTVEAITYQPITDSVLSLAYSDSTVLYFSRK